MMTHTEAIVTERGVNYGHPAPGFKYVRTVSGLWEDLHSHHNGIQKLTPRDGALAHAIYMINVKLSRLASTIDHDDSWDDIAGYVQCAKMILATEVDNDR